MYRTVKPTISVLSLIAAMIGIAAVTLDKKDDAPVLREADTALKGLGKSSEPAKAINADKAFAKGEYEEAIRLATPRAEAGDPNAIYLMGFASETGKGVPQSGAKAIEYYRQGMAKGHADSTYRLAMNLVASGQATDAKEAQGILEKQAAKDPAVAGRFLGEFFLRGSFTAKPDPDTAVMWWEKASAAGDVPSMNFLVALYDGQLGFPDRKDAKLMLENYGAAAAKGDTPAMVNLGSRLLTAAKGGFSFAQNELGIFYLSGKLGVADFSAAFSWFTRAAKENFAPAQNNLATLYERGAGVPQAYDNALQLYTLAAQQGYSGATLALARLNATGAGTRQNLEAAWALATIAGERGEENAAAFITEIEKNLTKEQLAGAKKELDRMKSGNAPK